jgi:hypothetical protein
VFSTAKQSPTNHIDYLHTSIAIPTWSWIFIKLANRFFLPFDFVSVCSTFYLYARLLSALPTCRNTCRVVCVMMMQRLKVWTSFWEKEKRLKYCSLFLH